MPSQHILIQLKLRPHERSMPVGHHELGVRFSLLNVPDQAVRVAVGTGRRTCGPEELGTICPQCGTHIVCLFQKLQVIHFLPSILLSSVLFRSVCTRLTNELSHSCTCAHSWRTKVHKCTHARRRAMRTTFRLGHSRYEYCLHIPLLFPPPALNLVLLTLFPFTDFLLNSFPLREFSLHTIFHIIQKEVDYISSKTRISRN